MTEDLTRSRTRVAGFDDGELDFQLLRQLGAANYGGASVGQTLAAAAAIGARGSASWTPVFAATGDRQRVEAEQRWAAGHVVSAREQYLMACNSYRAAEYFAPIGSPRHHELGAASQQAFTHAVDLAGLDYQRLEITVDGLRLPGYWFAATGPATGRVLVATSGFDGTLEETYLQVGRAAAERGWSLLLIAGPGTGTRARTPPETEPSRSLHSLCSFSVVDHRGPRGVDLTDLRPLPPVEPAGRSLSRRLASTRPYTTAAGKKTINTAGLPGLTDPAPSGDDTYPSQQRMRPAVA